MPNLFKMVQNKEIILLDIEGTTTSISFVRDVLFPKAREEVGQFLLNNYEDERMLPLIQNFREQVMTDVSDEAPDGTPLPDGEPSKEDVVSCLVGNFYAMMAADSKVVPLKALQGAIWKNAYEKGTIKGHVYNDVLPALKEWEKAGKRICIFSSGSIEAQKLLFKHSTEGDILHFFSNHFDTSIGQKSDPLSYERIAQTLKVDPKKILFITDVENEAVAASSAGMDVVISCRPGNADLSFAARQNFQLATTFDALFDFGESVLSHQRP